MRETAQRAPATPRTLEFISTDMSLSIRHTVHVWLRMIAALATSFALLVSVAPTAVGGALIVEPTTYYVALDVESDEANSGCDAPLVGTGDEGEVWSDDPDAAIQAAINEAEDGDTIHICAGTWLLDQAEGDRINGDDQLSTNNKQLTIEGAGASKTELISDSYGRIISSADSLGDFSEAITIRDITLSGGNVVWNGGAVVAYGVTCEDSVIRNSQTGAWNEDTERGNGGGIYSTGPVTLDGCTVTGNTAQGSGGGVALESAALNVTNSTISNNTAVGGCCGEYGFGGGVYRAWSPAELNIEGSLFVDNDSEDTGGALSARGPGNATITSTEFRSNHSDYWGGAFDFNGIWTLDDVDFIQNSATLGGGAIDNSGGGADVLIITNSRFVGNTSPGGGGEGGGAILNNGGRVEIDGSLFSGNTIGDNSQGGAVYANVVVSLKTRYEKNLAGHRGGAIAADVSLYSSQDRYTQNQAGSCGAVHAGGGELTRSYFSGNSSEAYGGAGCLHYTSVVGTQFVGNSAFEAGALWGFYVTIRQSTFDSNRATRYLGGAAVLSGPLVLSDSTFSRNTAARFGGAVHIGGYAPNSSWVLSGNRFTRNTAASGGGAIDVGTCVAGPRNLGRTLTRGNRFGANRVFHDNRTTDISVRAGNSVCAP